MDINPNMMVDTNYQSIAPEALQAKLKNKSYEKQKAAAEEFEAVFIQTALKEMRPKIEGGIFNEGLAQDVFHQFMDQAIAKEIAASESNFGIADQIMKQNF